MYQPVNPPFEHEFVEMSQDELQAYFDWFLASIPGRVKELEAEVRRTPGFETWVADLTPASLDSLGEWFVGQVEERPLTDDESKQGRESVPEKASFLLDELPTTTPTFRTLSLTFDVGIYLGQVFLKNRAGLSWQQFRGDKAYDDYGQPAIVGLGVKRCPTLSIATVVAYGIADGEETGTSLRDVYEVWMSKR
jgi:hypothetical protein